MKKKRRRIRPAAVVVLLLMLLILVTGIYLLLTLIFGAIGNDSINPEASRYKNGKCVVYYPSGSLGKSYAKELCASKQEKTLDYQNVSFGDFHHIIYDEIDYFTDVDYNEAKLNGDVSDKALLSDYLIYCMKKDDLDIAYTSDFLLKNNHENIDISNVEYSLVSEREIGAYFKEYDYQAVIPSCYVVSMFKEDLGVEGEIFNGIKYINPNRKMLALTFDDGPNIMEYYLKTSCTVVEALNRYGCNGTFFVVGNRLNQDCVDFIEYSVGLGNEYGSHTYSHGYLTNLSVGDLVDEISWPGKRLHDAFGYEMKLYRPPYGAVNSTVKEYQPYLAVLWNVDSTDWELHDTQLIADKVLREIDENDVVLFHDIYESSARAVEKLIPILLDDGYQLVTISEMLEALQIDQSSISVFSGK